MSPAPLDPSLSPAASPATSASSAGVIRRNRGKLIAIAVLLVIAVVAGGYTAATLAYSYSTGERVGFVQKMSKKGWICRTWEGELAMSPVPGAAPQLFPFTVRDDGVAARISQSEGKRVALTYEQKIGLPSSCFGETAYFVKEVRVLGQ